MAEAFVRVCTSEDRPTWMAERQGGITATDIARLHTGGAGTWAAIRAEKAGTARDFQTAAMAYGSEREARVIEHMPKRWGMTPCGWLLRSTEVPWALATPDAWNEQEEVVGEVKTTVEDWQQLADAPRKYVIQILWQMLVTGYRKGRLVFEPHEDGVPLYPEPKYFDIEWDQDLVDALIATAEEFRSGPGEADENAVELDELLTQHAQAKAAQVAATTRVADLEDRIVAAAKAAGKTKFEGTAANLTMPKPGTRTAFNAKAFKEKYPAAHARFMETTPTNGKLTITPRKADA